MKLLKKLLTHNKLSCKELLTLKTDFEWYFKKLIGFNKDKSRMYAMSAISWLTESQLEEILARLSKAESNPKDRDIIERLYLKGEISIDDLFTLRHEFYDFYHTCVGFNEEKSDYWANAIVGYLANIDSLYELRPSISLTTPRIQ